METTRGRFSILKTESDVVLLRLESCVGASERFYLYETLDKLERCLTMTGLEVMGVSAGVRTQSLAVAGYQLMDLLEYSDGPQMWAEEHCRCVLCDQSSTSHSGLQAML